jgi:hypothetical protein
VILHGCREETDVLNIAAYYAESRIAAMSFVVPFPAGGEIVIQSHRRHGRIDQQPIGKVAANESGAAYEKIPF